MATRGWFALIALAVGAAISSDGTALAQTLPLPSTDNVILSFSRAYGRAVFNVCRLGVVIYESRGTASLFCDSALYDPKGRRAADLNARLELTPDETKQLTAAVRSARLFDGGHIGVDGQAGDGIFDTLKVVKDGRAVVLVTSGNSTFDSGPRNQLLSMLTDLDKRLREKASSQKSPK